MREKPDHAQVSSS